MNTGELVALLGPSGSGKTTLLLVIAGMEAADPGGGPILFDGIDVSARDVGNRQIGFVFQHYALFKRMTVFENIAFGLRSKPWRLRPKEPAIRAKVEELLRLIQLQNLAQRYPSQLSGGQRQRVALARALAVEPRVLLLDEPFGALDATVRRELRRWLRKLHDTIHVTTIFVTHDQEEALEVSDRIAIMNAGRIEQFGSPEDVYEHPANPFVFRFLGNYNLFHAREEASPHGIHADQSTRTANVTFVRPHDIEIRHDNADGSGIAAKIAHIGFVGSAVNIEVIQFDNNIHVDVALTTQVYKDLGLKLGDEVFIKPLNTHSFVTTPPS